MAKITEEPEAVAPETVVIASAPRSHRGLAIGGIIGGAVLLAALTFGGGVAVGLHVPHGDARGFSEQRGPQAGGQGGPGGDMQQGGRPGGSQQGAPGERQRGNGNGQPQGGGQPPADAPQGGTDDSDVN